MADSWVERTVNLKANTVKEVATDYGKLMNTFIIKNLTAYPIYVGLKPNLSTADYEIQVQPGDYGIIVRPYEFQKVYLLTTSDVTVTVYLVWTQNPMTLLPNMAKPVESTNVDVVKTVGLKASELNLDANKNLGVNVNSLPSLPTGTNNIGKVDVNSLPSLPAGTNNIGKVDINSLPSLPAGTNNIGKVDVNSLPSLPAGTNNIGKVDINSLPETNPAGWTWAKVTAEAEGDVTVKAGPGKVAMLINDSTATIILKDGANQAWKAGDFISYGCPLKCNTSIVVNFSAAGQAWILYQ